MLIKLQSLVGTVAVAVCLGLPGSSALAQIDNPNPPPEPRSLPSSAVDASASGTFTTSLAVALPAARGPVPSIGLSYSSAPINGLAGVGWGTAENRDDRLVNGAGKFYRKKVRAGAPPEQFGPSAQSCGSGPCYWEMRDGTGTTYYFGGDASAHPGLSPPDLWHAALWEPYNGVTQNRGIIAWPLYKVVDPDANYYVITYSKDGITFRPRKVEYNLPLVGAQGRAMSVRFEYENRPDRTPMPGYHSRRLKNIRVYGESTPPGAGTLIRRYELGYTASQTSGRSLLTSFQKFGTDGDGPNPVGLEPQTFSYTPGIDLVGDYTYSYSGDPPKDLVDGCRPGPDEADCLWNSFVGDLNADGRADFVRTYYGTYGGKVLYRCGGRSWELPAIEHSNYPDAQPTYLTAMGDFDGDGRQDLVAIYPDDGIFTTYIAYGAHANNRCALGGWILQPSQTVSDTIMSASPADWRILAADLDGDGMSDAVLFDAAKSVLYWKMYRSGQLSATRAGRYRSGAEWTSCNEDYPYQSTVGFNGIDVTDYNGDGKADVVLSWSRRDMIGTRFPGMISILTVMGTSSGLGPPTEACHTTATSYGPPAVRFPYTAMRQGDINGDGRGDSILTYQGKAHPHTSYCDHNLCLGAIHGRDIRFRLGTTLAAGSSLEVYTTDPSTYPYAAAYERPAHLNEWEFATADINGDGIEDYIQSYAGAHGDKLYYALGTPTGLGPLVARVDTSSEVYDNGDAYYPKSTIAVGDFNGDELSDVARVRFSWAPPSLIGECFRPPCDGSGSTSLEIYWGSANGLSSTAYSRSYRDMVLVGGDSRSLTVLVADIDGNATDDLLFANNNAEPPSTGNLPKGQGAFVDLEQGFLDTSSRDDAGLPDMLSSINNGVLGTTTVTYRLARDFPNAIRPDWPNQCYGLEPSSTVTTGYITGAMCGQVDSRPRALVRSIVSDYGIARDGVTFKEQLEYDYNNGRVYGGPPEQRADLGFSSVTSTNLDTGTYTLRWYRQDKPFEGSRAAANSYLPHGIPLHRSSYVYSQHAHWNGVTVISLSDSFSCAFEEGLPLPCVHQNMSYHYAYLVLMHRRNGTDDIPGENAILTNVRYTLDGADWLFRPLSSWTYRRSASGATIVLDMRRLTYDTAAGKTTHVLKRERILFEDAESATCTVIDDPWNPDTCSERLTSGAARWVTSFTTSSSNYDPQGNLTWFGSYPVSRDAPNPAWQHPVTLAYDETYKGLVASTTNALNQTTSYTYDPAGRLLTTTDPNNQTTTFGYDVYGRPETYSPPGVGLYQKRWTYAGVDPVRGYQVKEFTYSTPTRIHRANAYFDGFGGLAQTRDYTETSDLTIDNLNEDVWVEGQRVRRGSWPYYAGEPIPNFIETTFDARGRPLRIARVKNDAAFTTDITASGRPAVDTFAYGLLGNEVVTTHTDANGNSQSAYTNYRGLVTRVTDAAGKRTRYGYSTAFRLARVTLPSTKFNTVTYTYDSWGRLKSENDPNGGGFVAYNYDDASMLTKKTYYRSSATTSGNGPLAIFKTRELMYYYDQLDRPTSERVGSAPSSDQVRYIYDELTQTNGIGRLTTVIDASGTTKYNYDGRGNLTAKTITLNGLSGSITYRYTYDDRDLVTRVAFPDAVQNFTYTADGVLTGVIHNGVSWGSWSQFDVFKRAGMFQAYDNGRWTNTTTYAYDVDQRIARIVQKQKDDTVVQDLSYAYDAVGNVRSITDNRATKIINGINTDLTQTFAYDALYRLCATWVGTYSTITTANSPSSSVPAQVNCPSSGTTPTVGSIVGTINNLPPTATFTYDGIGNLLTDSGTINTYTTIGDKRVIENRTGTTLNWRAYQDSEGKRTRFEDCSFSPCENYSYGYDPRGRLVSVTQNGVVRESYEYDFTDKRTKKSYNNLSNTAHAWSFGPSYMVRKNSLDPSRISKTLSIAGIATHTYGDKIVGQASASTVDSKINLPFTGSTDQAVPLGIYLRQPDLLGSQTLITRASDGAAVSRNTYDAWGSHLPANSLGQDTTYEKFTGQQQEGFSGLAYYGFRYYHPKTRRFITPDDRLGGGGAQGYNRFAYVRNNPATYIDPSGHQDVRAETCPGCRGNGNGTGSSSGGQSGGWNELCNFSLLCSGIRALVEESKGGGSGGSGSRESGGTTVTIGETEYDVHVVKAGETLGGIAKKSYGRHDYYPLLWSSNSWIVNPHWIYPGQPVLIPRASVAGETPISTDLDPELAIFAQQRADWIRQRLTEADAYHDVRVAGVLGVFAPGNVTRSWMEATANWIQTGPPAWQLTKIIFGGEFAMGGSVLVGKLVDFVGHAGQFGKHVVGAAPEGAYISVDAEADLRRELERLDAFLEGR
jgi:RHS repeat-associated protein